MPYYLLLSRSITHAQRMNFVLRQVGISSTIYRPPVGLSDKGCSYAVRVTASYFLPAMTKLKETELLPVRIFYTTGDGAYREIQPR